jgi:hypothetical protein
LETLKSAVPEAKPGQGERHSVPLTCGLMLLLVQEQGREGGSISLVLQGDVDAFVLLDGLNRQRTALKARKLQEKSRYAHLPPVAPIGLGKILESNQENLGSKLIDQLYQSKLILLPNQEWSSERLGQP